MVVLQINIKGVSASKPESDSPIARNGYCPGSLSVAFQLVKVPPRNIHILDFTRAVEIVKLPPDSWLVKLLVKCVIEEMFCK